MPRLAVLAAVVLTAAGCAAVRPKTAARPGLPDRFPRHTLAEVLGAVAAADTLAGLTARGEVVLASPDQNGRFATALDAARDGRMYLTVSALGIEGGRALVRPDSFFLHNRLENELTLGRTEDAGSLLPLPLSATDGFRALTGTLRPETAAGFALDTDLRQGLYLVRSADGRRVFTVDPALWRVVRVVRYDGGGALAEEILYDAYAPDGGALLPHRISVRRPADRFAATLVFRTAHPTATPDVPDRLRVPAGTRRRPL